MSASGQHRLFMSTSPEALPQDPPPAEKLKVSRTRKLVRVLLALMVVLLSTFCVLFHQIWGFEELVKKPPGPPIKAEAQMNTIGATLLHYQKKNGRLPTTEEGLKALVEPPPTALVKRTLVKFTAIMDPWGHPYQYRLHEAEKGPGPRFDLWSFGADGVDGTADDVIHRKIAAK